MKLHEIDNFSIHFLGLLCDLLLLKIQFGAPV
jgi:hypothetical protein